MSLWALNPALAFDDLAGANAARCVVLTSGTLAPLNSFASELGVQFPIRMEAPHCVDVGKQVWAGAVGVGPRGAQLCGTFKVAAEFAYQDDLGNALKGVVRGYSPRRARVLPELLPVGPSDIAVEEHRVVEGVGAGDW